MVKMPEKIIEEFVKDESVPIYEVFREILGFGKDDDPEDVKSAYKKRTSSVCKPCWELKYCPYGSLVEQFPLPRVTREIAVNRNERLKKCLSTGLFRAGEPLTENRRKFFENEVETFNIDEHPEKLSKFEIDASCSIYGHLCPVFFVNVPFTETSEMRRIGRHIPTKTMIRVARRDNNTCQICGKNLLDYEIEFDHIIPVSKGGNSEESNLRITCFDCNRSKSDNVDL